MRGRPTPDSAGLVQPADIGVEERLGGGRGLLAAALQAPEQQDHVQAVELEAPIGRVGRAELGVEGRSARLAAAAAYSARPAALRAFASGPRGPMP
jgi:hypothetical protein